MVVVKDGVWCDPCLVPLVKALNDAGIRTVASCCGHGHRPGNIVLEDGRELVIARDWNEAREIDALFPIDINGDAMTLLVPEHDPLLVYCPFESGWFGRRASRSEVIRLLGENGYDDPPDYIEDAICTGHAPEGEFYVSSRKPSPGLWAIMGAEKNADQVAEEQMDESESTKP